MDLRCVAKITAFHGRSTSGAFKDVRRGDIIVFDCPITKSEVGAKSLAHAKKINVINMRTGGKTCLTFNKLAIVIKNFEFEELLKEVVNCKNCAHFQNGHLCLHWSKHGTIEVKPDDFCSYAEGR